MSLKPWSSKRIPLELTGEMFGVSVTLSADDAKLMSAMLEWLPPQWNEGGEGVEPLILRLSHGDNGTYQFERHGEVQSDLSYEDVIRSYEWTLRNYVAATSPSSLFIHAGVVALGDRAILIPGPSFSGKTTLVDALVAAGATYYSDEYAVIDDEGLVHPYPKPISIREAEAGGAKRHYRAEDRGAVIGDRPLSIGLVVCTQYRSDANWEPTELTPAQAALELVQHSRAAEERVQSTLATLAKAVQGCATLTGPRGDATLTARALLARMDLQAAPAAGGDGE